MGTSTMIAATLTLADAARQVWDVAIVGAGPAGALAARELARAGLSVLLIDRASFPRWKVCGCCLNGRAIAILRNAGLCAILDDLHAIPLREIIIARGGAKARIPLHGGAVLSREALDAAVARAAVHEGVSFLPNTLATDSAVAGEVRTLIVHRGAEAERISARVVLAADGLGGRFGVKQEKGAEIDPQSWIGAGSMIPIAPDWLNPGTIAMACGDSGYAGLVRLEDGRLNIAAALSPILVKERRGVARAAATLLSQAGLPTIAGIGDALWRGTPALTRRASRLATDRLFVLGDAAGYVEPFTGQGIAWAFAAGQAVVSLVPQAIHHWSADIEQAWTERYRRIVADDQRACRVLAWGLRRPLLTAAATALLRHFPNAAQPFLRRVHQATS